jgi:hypothetical protein
MLAEWTGLEPATPGVTGRYSNRLNYHSAVFLKNLLGESRLLRRTNLNNTDLNQDDLRKAVLQTLVGAEGFEPPTLAL